MNKNNSFLNEYERLKEKNEIDNFSYNKQIDDEIIKEYKIYYELLKKNEKTHKIDINILLTENFDYIKDYCGIQDIILKKLKNSLKNNLNSEDKKIIEYEISQQKEYINFIHERTYKWIKIIESEILKKENKEKKILIFCGAGHIPKLLENLEKHFKDPYKEKIFDKQRHNLIDHASKNLIKFEIDKLNKTTTSDIIKDLQSSNESPDEESQKFIDNAIEEYFKNKKQ